MKIATWNVNSGAIAERVAELRSEFDADIVALQESAEPTDESSTCIWNGDYKRKGVSLSSRFPHGRAAIDGESSPFIASRVMDSDVGGFNVLALWAKPSPSYFADLVRTLDLNRQFIREAPTFVLGDFNLSLRNQSTGKQFYVLNAKLNHEFDVHSAYHEFTGERFGMETMTTLYYQWGSSGCFHCDFIYIPSEWISRVRSVTIPGYRSFASSDHRPVFCEVV
ncbi:MAG: endonuclease/exonuclease/phosphatase family protein [Cyanobacteria bacterium P01_F01_bin.56]